MKNAEDRALSLFIILSINPDNANSSIPLQPYFVHFCLPYLVDKLEHPKLSQRMYTPNYLCVLPTKFTHTS